MNAARCRGGSCQAVNKQETLQNHANEKQSTAEKVETSESVCESEGYPAETPPQGRRSYEGPGNRSSLESFPALRARSVSGVPSDLRDGLAAVYE